MAKAKLIDDPAVKAVVDKAVADALKAERKRVSACLKDVELPEGTTARQGSAIKKAVKDALATE